MPNWCDNQITITGPNSVIDKIEKIVKEESNDAEKGLLQFFHPMRQGSQRIISKLLLN